jgi:hypothetical protein
VDEATTRNGADSTKSPTTHHIVPPNTHKVPPCTAAPIVSPVPAAHLIRNKITRVIKIIELKMLNQTFDYQNHVTVG